MLFDIENATRQTRFRGRFDAFSDLHLGGWAIDPLHPTRRRRVRLEIDRQPVVEIEADQFRQDLLDAGLGDGRCGFTFVMPEAVRDGRQHVVRVVDVELGLDVPGSPYLIGTAPFLDAAGLEEGGSWVDSPDAEAAIDTALEIGELSERLGIALMSWRREGFLLLRAAFAAPLAQAALRHLTACWTHRMPVSVRPPVGPQMPLSDWLARGPAHDLAFRDLHAASAAVAEIAMAAPVTQFLRQLYQEEAGLLDAELTLAARPEGARQGFPFHHGPRAGSVVRAFAALQDMAPEAGALTIFPRSHRMAPIDLGLRNLLVLGEGPHVTNYGETLVALAHASGAQRATMTLSCGDVLLVHPRLVVEQLPPQNREAQRALLTTRFLPASALQGDGEAVPGRNGAVFIPPALAGFPHSLFPLEG
ncbi:hypothetical protein EOD42_20980 [Rhodovarius crocodyli]|uniref:Uncharacterized protein n=1 Tax=Rhodovarius crocodyli TaxID=1979269 RepID=A0A437M2F0_9PROT|nr:phytanoyl-CoA dioxygenase family protein [Rhodovarius crocodyli]RVT91792.1 hypothetical protein EOD42_20980 [Rhodovarius crocodyli]